MLNLYGVHTYFMNKQDPQAPRKSKKNGGKNLNEHKPHLNFIFYEYIDRSISL